MMRPYIMRPFNDGPGPVRSALAGEARLELVLVERRDAQEVVVAAARGARLVLARDPEHHRGDEDLERGRNRVPKKIEWSQNVATWCLEVSY